MLQGFVVQLLIESLQPHCPKVHLWEVVGLAEDLPIDKGCPSPLARYHLVGLSALLHNPYHLKGALHHLGGANSKESFQAISDLSRHNLPVNLDQC